VALVAGDGFVLASERIGSCLVAVQRECGRLKTGFDMTGGTFSAVGTLLELPLVWVRGCMAIETSGMRERAGKVSAVMTGRTRNRLVLAAKRELRAGMIEVGHCAARLAPSVGVVARLAGGRETSAMRVCMARGAGTKPQPCVLDVGLLGNGRVTLPAIHFLMQARQRVTGVGMVKP
jgi:hypothetical protein